MYSSSSTLSIRFKMAVLVRFSSGFATQSPLNVVFWTLLTTQKSRVSVTKYWQHGAKT